MLKYIVNLFLIATFSTIFAHRQQQPENQLNLPENLAIEREVIDQCIFYKVRMPHLAVVAVPPMPDIHFHYVALREMRGDQQQIDAESQQAISALTNGRYNHQGALLNNLPLQRKIYEALQTRYNQLQNH